MIARILIYVVIKWLVESLVCFARVRQLDPARPAFTRSLRLGAVRVLVGRGVMLLVWDTPLHAVPESVLAAVMVGILWIEWSVMDLIIENTRFRPAGILAASDSRGNVWRLEGVAASILVNLGGVLAGIRLNELWV